MTPPGLSNDPGLSSWAAAVDVTASRSLNSNFTNGSRRRMCFVTVTCAAAVAGLAQVGYITVVAGVALSLAGASGPLAGVALSSTETVVFVVDPGATYQTTSQAGTGASVTLQKWLEVDL